MRYSNIVLYAVLDSLNAFQTGFLKIFVVTVFSNTLLPDIKCLLLLFLNVSTPRHPCQYATSKMSPGEDLCLRNAKMATWLDSSGVHHGSLWCIPFTLEFRSQSWEWCHTWGDCVPVQKLECCFQPAWPLLAVPVDNNELHSILCRENVHKKTMDHAAYQTDLIRHK